ncbi:MULTISPECIES: metalloregulator ArsR/SmtB family transcription factor [Anaerococcus]|jgi:transcriptional repressor|uniref:HTH-type transcriptional repressor CzrA n=1 Tax=Anaerococcus octavius TaxID=54007 RepID=A0A2I1MAX6_9FIRM|nr:MULTISPECIES: metalloregulator ArsR/SmtB family transcription factor [Anaerococcus]MBS6105482.1 winged helix-turn-helix transcriptional regulator [Anaerococcus sp.]MDU4026635.1 metalloregulator ArsR/SmtB family transcription factor [Anaerococcus sp.]MDU7412258.1 metalloregulator ArsR/SmtB family transcription factor [Anaerococcus sp.]PKZ17280.1 transcriptional regulator [Anaerococcus octavius]SUU92956.1 HTH-type transcriptional repressor CzrA [Anaerococcus octavius]
MDESIKNARLEDIMELSDLFKVFADSTRLRILHKLFNGPISVGVIAEALDMSQSAISHQLKYLKNSNLVKSERNGKSIYYSLADDHIKTIFKTGLEHINE